MSKKHLGAQTLRLARPPAIVGYAAVVGKKEAEGPLGTTFDRCSSDTRFGEKTWEKAEARMQKTAVQLALEKAGLAPSQLHLVFAGDLLNQCIGSAFGLRELGVPFLGLYGACSTMAEGLALAAMSIDGGFADHCAAVTSSHFCSAERQYRNPLEYGGQRPPTAQWTVTGSGAVILASEGDGPFVTHITVGRITDLGIKDANNMGAAMAPAACDTLSAFFRDTGSSPADYDRIFTGDLGALGYQILLDLLRREGLDPGNRVEDCGLLIYDRDRQDVHCGGSGCGCSASVLAGHLLPELAAGRWNRILFAGTGALLSPTSTQQGESIPSICHLVCIDRGQEVRHGRV